jgi:Toastrack DUF4097
MNRTSTRRTSRYQSQRANHPRRRSGFSLLALGLGASLMLGGCDSFGPSISQQRLMEVPHIAGSTMRVESANGWIEVVAVDRPDVSILVNLRGHSFERLDLTTVRAHRLDDGTLRVWVEWPGGIRKNGEGASVSIEVPDVNGIEAHSSNGHILIAGLSGRAELISTNGRIEVQTHDGSLYADTSNGDLKAEHVSGEIEMYSSNGRVIITDAFGPIRAETSNGNVYISTMDGNEGPLRIRTSNGRVDLDLGEGFVGMLRAHTSNGKVQVAGLEGANLIESTGHSVELRVDDSAQISDIRTSNGSVRVQGRHTEPSGG